MSKSSSKVDSDPASPTTNPVKHGKRGTEDVIEPYQFVYSKKQKIVKQNKVDVPPCINSAVATQDARKDSQHLETSKESLQDVQMFDASTSKKTVEIPSSLNSAASTQEANKASSSNDFEQDDISKIDLTPQKSVEVPLASKSTSTTQDAERVSISNEYDEQDIDDEVYQHLETPNKIPQTPISSTIVLMDNLNLSIKEEDVKSFFKIVGEIVQVHFDMKEGYFSGHGHVEFTTTEAAQEALKLNNKLLLDHPVRLNLATERAEHEYNTTSHTTGSKTVYLGNLSFAIEEDDV